MPFQQIDLRELSEKTAAERAFVSLYLSGPESLEKLDDRERRILELLDDNPTEKEHFERSLAMIREALEEHSVDGPMALFAAWASDFLVGYPLEVAPEDLLRIDSSPYIRPLAELQDEYEDFLVVTADAERSRIHLVASDVAHEVERVRGDVKNKVKKGGWSQMRYQRRRAEEMAHYAEEVAEAVADIARSEGIERIVLLGAKEAMREIEEALPQDVAELVVGERAVDVDRPDEALMDQAREEVEEQERADERSLWERIRGEGLSQGLAAFGPGEVLAAAQEGRVEEMVVTRDAEIEGMRCRDCELLAHAKPQQCPRCDSSSVFAVDLVEEIVELLETTSARADFVDPLPGLSKQGDVAAMLRY